MTNSLRSSRSAAFALGLATLASVGIAGQGSAPAAPAPKVWVASYSNSYGADPTQRAGVLNSIAPISRTKVLASGFTWPELNGPYTPVVKLWNGHRWRTWAHQPAMPSNENDYDPAKLAASSLSNVWLEQVRSSIDFPTTNLLHWDGHHWKVAPADGLPLDWNGDVVVHGSHTWVVGEGGGDYLHSFNNGAFAAEYRHHRWTMTRLTRVGGLLTGFARTATDVWAVGGTDLTSASSGRPLVEHLVKGRWQQSPVPLNSGQLTAVAASSSTSAMAVGGQSAIIWNGHKWHRVTPPSTATSLAAIAPARLGGYWMAGTTTSNPDHTVYYRYDDGKWTTEVGPLRSLPDAPDQISAVTAMATYKDTVWSAGYLAVNNSNCDDLCPNGVSGQLIVDRH